MLTIVQKDRNSTRNSTGWMVYCGSSSDSFGLGLLMFSLKSLMKDGTAVSLCWLVLQDGEDSLTPLGEIAM